MNERVMQFRIGMFVIVAGLVLTMLIVWFGESPSLLRDQVYLKVRYAEAPGVLEGVAVRKSGIRVGEVVAIAFDERPNAARRRARDAGHRAQVPDPRGLGPPPHPVAHRRCDHRHASRHRQGEPASGPHARPRPRSSRVMSPSIPARRWPPPPRRSSRPATRSRASTRPPPASRSSRRTPTSSTASSRPGPRRGKTSRAPPRAISQFLNTNEADFQTDDGQPADRWPTS